MNVKWNANSEMKELLKEVSGNSDLEILKINSEKLKELFLPPLKKIKDCIIISEKNITESQFNNAMTIQMDKTGYETCNTETRINDYFEDEISMITGTKIALMVIEVWALKLKQMEPGAKFCLIMCSDEERVEIRFHKVRKGESWLAEDLECYKGGGVGYIVV